jgi:SOS response regulatory protein OraA/RecX
MVFLGENLSMGLGGKVSDSNEAKLAKAEAKADKAREKALRPWFKKKRIVIPIALLVIIGISTANSGGSGSPEETVASEDVVNSDSEATPVETQEAEEFPDESVSQANAREMANSYLQSSAFSLKGLIEQLEYEGFSNEDATYGAEATKADWKEQALLSAESYLRSAAFSQSGLKGQLVYEGFTDEEAEYGATNVEADWNEQAAKSAESYLNSSAFSRQGLIDQLLYEGFSQKQAEYGVTQAGL